MNGLRKRMLPASASEQVDGRGAEGRWRGGEFTGVNTLSRLFFRLRGAADKALPAGPREG